MIRVLYRVLAALRLSQILSVPLSKCLKLNTELAHSKDGKLLLLAVK